MIVTICYFSKSIKSVFILVQCNTSLSKNYVVYSYVTVVFVVWWIWANKLVCLRSLAVCAHEISCRTSIFSTDSHSTTKPLKHSWNFESGENVRSSNVVEFEFELRHTPIQNVISHEVVVCFKMLQQLWEMEQKCDACSHWRNCCVWDY